eukprot:gene12429-8524_t
MIEEMALEQLLCFPCDLLEQLAVSRWPPVTQKERPNKALPLPSVDAAAVRLSLQEIQTIIIGTPTNTTQLPPQKK